MADWRPKLEDDGQPAYVRIVAALATDIARGALAAGARLPTQRALAEELGLGVGTVTRAYGEAEQRGLIEAVVGRGSFVAAAAAAAEPDAIADLSRNTPPLAFAQAVLRGAIAALARRADLAERLDYAPAGGFEADRRAAARWLARTANFPAADPAALIVTAGAQQAIAVVLAAAVRPGEAVVAEAATWHGLKAAAAQLSLRLVPAAMDHEGLAPEALDRALAESGARAAYVQPFQNPTARVMSLARRKAIIEVARRRGALLIEDDLYGPVIGELGLAPLAQLAPDAVAYVGGLSKSLAPGMRVGFLVPPQRLRSACLEALRAAALGPPTLGALVGTQLIERGEAFEVLIGIRAELTRRGELADAILAGLVEPRRQRASPHIWAPASELDAERVAGQALRAGVKVTAPAAPFLAGAPVDGLRICLGPSEPAALRRGLETLREALRQGPGLAENVV
ncbi:MAG TPA: PLP-dependent aminotransferase family protein [Caulobacteraceae bacterium]